MSYNAQITRSDVAALVPEDVAGDVLSILPKQSAALSLFRQVRMSTKQRRMPVIAALPIAYFVDGDTGLKQTTDVSWDNVYLNAEELAVIVPIPEAVLDDTDYDIWGEIQPLMTEAMGRAIDNAIFFGVNKPVLWPAALAVQAAAVSHDIARGTHASDDAPLVLDFNDLFQTVELDGFDVNGMIARTTYKGILRGARDKNGNRIDDITSSSVFGVDVQYPMRGMWPTAPESVELLAGDFAQGMIGLRQDFTYKILDQAVIQDETGRIVYNLAQQDMVAMRLVFRLGFAVPNILNHDNPDAATRYPFAVMTSPAAPQG